MPKRDTTPAPRKTLRQRAEERLEPRQPRGGESDSAGEVNRLVHELQVHQVELEMQNEELRCTQADLEAERARYLSFHDMAPVGFLTLSEKGLILEANLPAAALLGAPRAALLGQPLTRFIFPAEHDSYSLYRTRASAGGETQECDLRLVRADGTTLWAHLVMAAAQGAGGVAVCRVVLADISERTRAEAALRESERKYRELVETANSIVLHWTRDGLVTFLNEFGQRFFGYSEAEILGRHVVGTIVPETESTGRDLRPLIERISADPQAFEHNVNENMRRNGEKVWIDWTNRVGFDDQGLVTGILSIGTDITERRRAEEALRHSELKFRQLHESMTDAFVLVGMDGRILECNQSFRDMLGRTEDELRHLTYQDITPEEWHTFETHIVQEQVLPRGSSGVYEKEYRRKDGTVFPVELRTVLLRDAAGQPAAMWAIIRDITERKHAEVERERLQAQLGQAQKMESVGRLAGGVAHEFNNKLMGIMGYVEWCRDELPPEHPAQACLDQMILEARHAADIARQLLAFARKQIIAPKVLDLTEALAGMLRMLRHLIGENVRLSWTPGAGLWPVLMDRSQLDQILADLCINARDAIAGTGLVAIETANVTLDEAYCSAHPDAVPGDYVRLAVSDTGCGMSQDTLSHLFEPFFTTKEVGQGTGLGLATVYGIIQQNHGHIEVRSEVGKGTTFCVYLPRADAASAAEPVAAPLAIPPPRGTETILLAEDEESVRTTTCRLLQRLGYTVLAADTPAEALRLAATHPGPIDLLVTDVVMPSMSGSELADLLAAERPAAKRLLMSGYAADEILRRGVRDAGTPLLAKPFSRDELAHKVREVLDADRAKATAG